jgi:hypothetical protein
MQACRSLGLNKGLSLELSDTPRGTDTRPAQFGDSVVQTCHRPSPLPCLTHLDRSNPAVITQVCEWHHGVGRLLPYLLPTPPLRPADALAKREKLAAKTVLNRAKPCRRRGKFSVAVISKFGNAGKPRGRCGGPGARNTCKIVQTGTKCKLDACPCKRKATTTKKQAKHRQSVSPAPVSSGRRPPGTSGATRPDAPDHGAPDLGARDPAHVTGRYRPLHVQIW